MLLVYTHQRFILLIVGFQIGKHFQEHRTSRLHVHQLLDALLHPLHIMSRQVHHIVLLADTLRRSMMLRHHQVFPGCALPQAIKLTEDGTATIVEHDDAKLAIQVLIPEGVLVVEETQILSCLISRKERSRQLWKESPRCHSRHDCNKHDDRHRHSSVE